MSAAEAGSPARRWRWGPVRTILAAILLSAVVVTALVVITEVPKWTCDPPGHLWLEAPDRCVALP